MKLISEFTENNIEFITEQDEKTGKKGYKIRGIFAQAEKRIETVVYIQCLSWKKL